MTNTEVDTLVFPMQLTMTIIDNLTGSFKLTLNWSKLSVYFPEFVLQWATADPGDVPELCEGDRPWEDDVSIVSDLSSWETQWHWFLLRG